MESLSLDRYNFCFLMETLTFLLLSNPVLHHLQYYQGLSSSLVFGIMVINICSIVLCLLYGLHTCRFVRLKILEIQVF